MSTTPCQSAGQIASGLSAHRGNDLERQATVGLLQLVNCAASVRGLVASAIVLLQELSGCEAIGIRLREGDDFPYFETTGFAPDFVKAESNLCSMDANGQVRHDSNGNPILECMCGNILSGRFDPSKPFFTEHGSFWTNSTTQLLSSTTEADRQSPTRNRCNAEGYESVALIPLKVGSRCLGLLQLNDRRKGMFTTESLTLWERIGDTLALALSQLELRQTLQESEARYRTLFDESPIPLWERDYSGAKAYLDKLKSQGVGDLAAYLDSHPAELLECYARTQSSKVNRAMLRLYRAADEAEFLAAFRTPPSVTVLEGFKKALLALAGGQSSFEMESTSRDLQGQEMQVMVKWTVPPSARDTLAHVIFSALDLTSQKRTERELRRSESHLARMQELAGIGSYEYEVPGRDAIWSAETFRLVGRDPSLGEPTAEEFVKCIHPDDRSIRQRALDAAVAQRKPFNYEYRVILPDGSLRYLQSVGQPVMDDAGLVTRIVGTCRDITERKLAERALRESELRFRGVVESDIVGITLVDVRTGRLIHANNAFLRIIGATEAQLRTGRLRWQDFTPPEALKWEANIIAEAHRSGIAKSYEKEYVRLDGTRVPVLLASAYYDEAHEHILGLALDLTERKRAEQALQESEKLAVAGRVAARVAHEINNPLAGIKNSFLLLKDAIRPDHPYFSYVGRIEKEIDRIGRVVRQMYNIYRPEREASREFALGETVADVVSLLRTSLHDGVQIVVDMPQSPVILFAPEDSVRQILFNLINNAVEASPGGGRVTVSASADASAADVLVADEGNGIPPDLRTRIFEPFFGAHRPAGKAGLGLGLSVSRSLAIAMGGSLDLVSEPGNSAVFRLRIPRRAKQ